MKLEEVKNILRCEVLYGHDKLGTVVNVGCGSDLMSDVLSFILPGSLLLTGLTNIQAVRTADIADVKAIVYVRGKRPDDRAVELAKEKGIPLLTTKYMMYEACGKLYKEGLQGKIDAAEKLK